MGLLAAAAHQSVSLPADYRRLDGSFFFFHRSAFHSFFLFFVFPTATCAREREGIIAINAQNLMTEGGEGGGKILWQLLPALV